MGSCRVTLPFLVITLYQQQPFSFIHNFIFLSALQKTLFTRLTRLTPFLEKNNNSIETLALEIFKPHFVAIFNTFRLFLSLKSLLGRSVLTFSTYFYSP